MVAVDAAAAVAAEVGVAAAAAGVAAAAAHAGDDAAGVEFHDLADERRTARAASASVVGDDVLRR